MYKKINIMKRSILIYINKLQAYKTAIKNIHWSSNNMSEHKLFDDIEDAVADVQDEIAEVAQGVYGKLKLNELKPRRYNISSSKKMLQDLLNDTQQFLTTLRSKELVGIKSSIEAFIGKIDQFRYLLDFCLKEDLKRRIVTKINENRREHELRKAIHEAVINVLNKI